MNKKSRDIKRGIAYEKRMAKKHHGKHVGGPGKEDYKRGAVKGEVKATKSKMTKSAIMKSIKEKGISEFASKSGFTNPAIEYCKHYHPEVKLFHGNKVVKKRTKKSS